MNTLESFFDIKRTPGKSLEYDYAYHNDTFISKLLLLVLGGVLGVFRGLLNAASNSSSVAATSRAKVSCNHSVLMSIPWYLLGGVAAVSAAFCGLAAYLIRKLRDGSFNEEECDTLAAIALGILCSRHFADDIIHHEGLTCYPQSVLLRRREVHCMMAFGESNLKITKALEWLEDIFTAQTKEMKIRLLRTLIEGWYFVGEMDKVSFWYGQAIVIMKGDEFRDQLAKFKALTLRMPDPNVK